MTWAEFLIRQHAYYRIEKNNWYKVREIAYSSLIGSHSDPKKLPKSKNDFIPLDDSNNNSLNENQIAVYKQVLEEYNNRK